MYEYDFHTYSIKRKRSKKKIVYWIIFIGIVILLVNRFSPDKKINEKTTLGDSTVAEIAENIVHKDSPLEQLVSKSLSGTQGSYAVVIENNKVDQSYRLNEHTVYGAGSFYKLWIMAVVFQQIEEGKLQEDDPLKADVAELNKKFHISSESAELKEGSLNFTVGSALRQMITISHNYAALALTEKIRLSSVEKFLAKNGFHESHVGGDNNLPTTTASDIALFFDKLLKGELANSEHTDKMLELLKAQKLNNKLPRYLPTGVIVAHKTAELGLFSHDGGIVYTPDGNYIIVVMSKSNYPPGAEDHISEISQNVYEYFRN